MSPHAGVSDALHETIKHNQDNPNSIGNRAERARQKYKAQGEYQQLSYGPHPNYGGQPDEEETTSLRGSSSRSQPDDMVAEGF